MTLIPIPGTMALKEMKKMDEGNNQKGEPHGLDASDEWQYERVKVTKVEKIKKEDDFVQCGIVYDDAIQKSQCSLEKAKSMSETIHNMLGDSSQNSTPQCLELQACLEDCKQENVHLCEETLRLYASKEKLKERRQQHLSKLNYEEQQLKATTLKLANRQSSMNGKLCRIEELLGNIYAQNQELEKEMLDYVDLNELSKPLCDVSDPDREGSEVVRLILAHLHAFLEVCEPESKFNMESASVDSASIESEASYVDTSLKSEPHTIVNSPSREARPLKTFGERRLPESFISQEKFLSPVMEERTVSSRLKQFDPWGFQEFLLFQEMVLSPFAGKPKLEKGLPELFSLVANQQKLKTQISKEASSFQEMAFSPKDEKGGKLRKPVKSSLPHGFRFHEKEQDSEEGLPAALSSMPQEREGGRVKEFSEHPFPADTFTQERFLFSVVQKKRTSLKKLGEFIQKEFSTPFDDKEAHLLKTTA
jgi:hypothetical protein